MLAAVAVLALASGAARAQNAPYAPPLGYQQDNRTQPCYPFSFNGREYCTDPLSGPGLDPPRVYYTAYDGSPICAEIRDALNRALVRPEESARSVMRPLPDSILHATYQRDPTAKTYESKNPLYADPMFLNWEYLNGVSRFDGETENGNPLMLYNDLDFARYLIAPVLNDGVRHLVYSEGRVGAYLWDVSQDQLIERDWSDWRSYRPWKPMPNACPVSRGVPLADFRSLCSFVARGTWFPKLSETENRELPWVIGNRAVSVVNFALIRNHFYEVLHTPNVDVVIVVDTRLPVGDDVCYLRSKSSDS